MALRKGAIHKAEVCTAGPRDVPNYRAATCGIVWQPDADRFLLDSGCAGCTGCSQGLVSGWPDALGVAYRFWPFASSVRTPIRDFGSVSSKDFGGGDFNCVGTPMM